MFDFTSFPFTIDITTELRFYYIITRQKTDEESFLYDVKTT